MAWQDTIWNVLLGTGGFIAIIVVIALLVIGWLLINKHWLRYQKFRCIIWRVDGLGKLNFKTDNAGIFVDRATQKKRLFLKGANVGLNPDNIPYIPSGRKPTIMLLQVGLKNFRFIKPNIDHENISFTVGEEDVNWAIFDYEKQKKKFDQNWLTQYMPFIILAFVSLIILILFMYLFKQFGTIKELIIELQNLAKILASAKSGTTII